MPRTTSATRLKAAANAAKAKHGTGSRQALAAEAKAKAATDQLKIKTDQLSVRRGASATHKSGKPAAPVMPTEFAQQSPTGRQDLGTVRKQLRARGRGGVTGGAKRTGMAALLALLPTLAHGYFREGEYSSEAAKARQQEIAERTLEIERAGD